MSYAFDAEQVCEHDVLLGHSYLTGHYILTISLVPDQDIACTSSTACQPLHISLSSTARNSFFCTFSVYNLRKCSYVSHLALSCARPINLPLVCLM